MNTDQIAGMVVGIFSGVGGVVALAWFVIQLIADWKIFIKAGEKGWKGLIPVYNLYVQTKFTWETKYFWIMLAGAVVGGILNSIGGIAGILGTICVAVSYVVSIMASHMLSKSFGHGVGFTVGLVLLGPIFNLILGFGSSQYLGNAGKGEV